MTAMSHQPRIEQYFVGRDERLIHAVRWTVQCQTVGEVGELLAQDEPATVEAGLQRLILDVKHRAGFFGRHALDVPEHRGRTVDRRQSEDCPEDRATELR